MKKNCSAALDGRPFSRLGEGSFTVGELLRENPPEYRNEFKREIYSEAAVFFASRQADLAIGFSRSTSLELSEIAIRPGAAKMPGIVTVPHYFRYDDPPSQEEMPWYLNFADPCLFFAYDSALFAQDEIQTLEHPMLAAVMLRLEGMNDPGLRPLTVENGRPTPWIFENVPRWIGVDTLPVDENGETKSIYGNAFCIADQALLRRAITIGGDPAACSNIIAMAAPSPGYGLYQPHQIRQLLGTVLAGFAPAVEASAERGRAAVIHTGRWGAGAFGGSEELALCVQIIGGMLSGVSKLCFHAVSEEFLENAREIAGTVVAASADAEEISEKLLAIGYEWGVSDGN